MSGALSGLRVLDLSTLFSAPQISAMLGDLGADVIKLEPRTGDLMRHMGATREGRSLMWAMVSRNKRAITLDLERPEGTALLHRLVECADVLVENHPQKLLERWHCSWEELSALNPRLVMVSVSGFGATGPYAGRAGNGSLAEAFAGLTHMTGEPDGPPMLTSLPLGDILTAISGVVGTLAACYHRDARGGGGQHVDVSMVEPVLQLLAGSVVGFDPNGPPPHRMGSRVSGGVPRNTYATSDDRFVVVSGTTDAQVGRVLAVIGHDDEASRARFGRSRERLRHADELDARVARWVAEHPRDEVVDLLTKARIPVAPVNDLADLLADPHIQARASVVEIHDDVLGPLQMVAPTPKLSATPGRIRHTGPGLGDHNHEVYAEWLGLEDEEVRALERDEIV
ncbi:CoA transferase [Myxococcota bacterium]|nr:CoA transferase [Myxococcota bacterium]